ncbi:hypothetical protein [Halorubrum sp. C191]|nr:hypothetical protein [Halorubrum sp. C191]
MILLLFNGEMEETKILTFLRVVRAAPDTFLVQIGTTHEAS